MISNSKLTIMMMLSATAMLMLATTVYSIDFDGIKKSISNSFDSASNTVKGAACLVENRDKFDFCNNELNRFEGKTIEETSDKERCCSFLAYRSCIQTTAQLYCGGYAETVVETMMDGVKAMFPANCEKYDNIFDCMNPILFWALVAAVAIVALLIIGSVIGCLKRMCC